MKGAVKRAMKGAMTGATTGAVKGTVPAPDARLPARRRALSTLGALLGAGVLHSGCSSTPPAQWYELRADPPEDEPGAGPTAAATRPAGPASASALTADIRGVWALSMAVALPAALDRDTLMVAQGQAGLLALAGHRWAEPLRDSVPRVLLADLQRLRGAGRVWPAPAPAGVAVTRSLRVAITVLQPAEDRRSLRLAAQWWLQDLGSAGSSPSLGQADFTVDVAGTTVDALAGAHRLALWRLAGRIAGSGGRAAGPS